METVANKVWSGKGRLANLVSELERQEASKLDLNIDSREFEIDYVGDKFRLMPTTPRGCEFLDLEGYELNRYALPQVGEKAGVNIGKRFIDAAVAAGDGDVVADLMNQLMTRHPAKRLVRILDGKVRGYLSDNYKFIDSLDLGFEALKVAKKVGAFPLSCSLSETHMRMVLTTKDVWDRIDKGEYSHNFVKAGSISNSKWVDSFGREEWDGREGPEDRPGGYVHPIVTIENSETGHGATNVYGGILESICFNMAHTSSRVRSIHLGGKLEEGMFSNETRSLEGQTVMSKMRDCIRGFFTPSTFSTIVQKAKAAQAKAIDAPQEAVDHVVKSHGLTQGARDLILAHFLGSQNPTQYGLCQAVARTAQDFDGANEAFELERLAGKLIEA